MACNLDQEDIVISSCNEDIIFALNSEVLESLFLYGLKTVFHLDGSMIQIENMMEHPLGSQSH